MLIIQKFGGTSVGDTDKIHNVANRIKMFYDQGHQLVVVVSAMGHTTDELVKMAARVNQNPPTREMDMLLSTGEQISISLLAMALDHIKVPAISFTGHQIEFRTDSAHSNARIIDINSKKLKEALSENKVCIV
ncbi:MAG: aspartate kinase, partial [Spirochaetia bacterium]|nr:aspartate kinase [Spirochaetia bacterium]